MEKMKEKIRHSLSHILASAVKESHPEVKFAIGPPIETGFYYDFELPEGFGSEELGKIEEKMREIVKKDLSFKQKEVSKQEARRIFADQPYKLELIDEIEGEKVSLYESGSFIDLCRGPHVSSSREIPLRAFELDKVAGAYWRGNEENEMLTRIYGLAFEAEEELENFLRRREEAKKRDHRVLGKKLGLFLIDEEFGKGLPLYKPKGARLRRQIMDFALKTYLKRGYQPVNTPHIARLDLWKKSGHWGFYRESMYSPMEVEDDKFVVKPMNCPGHVKIYNSRIRSYRDLPLRLTEMGTVYRFEKSGELHGLTRVRGFTQDDAHIFCTPGQLQEELTKTIDLTHYILSAFGFSDFEVSLSLRDPDSKEDFLGSDETWSLAEQALKKALQEKDLGYEKEAGEAAFYGPKIDILVKDAIGRKWQLSTIQVDFNFPEKFEMSYVDENGEEQKPIMLHRALLGSLERFMGILIEHYGGAFPFWLAPVQVFVIPVGSENEEYARKVTRKLEKRNFRTEIKARAETVSKKIREGETQKIPYMLVVGDKEEKKKGVAVRDREKGDLGMMKLTEFVEKAEKKSV